VLLALVDALAFSSLWVAAAAGALCAAASLAMGAAPALPVVGIAVAGTLFVYNVDRLRDVERDRATTPERSAFVARHRGALTGLAGAAVATSLAFALRVGAGPALLLLPVLAAGLAHRRLKRIPFAKSAYVTAAWLLVVVALPAVAGPATANAAWTAGVLGAAVFANAIASNVRDAEAAVARVGARPALNAARALAGVGVLLGAAAPPPVRPLLAVPLATLATLLAFREGERYGLIVVDGALLAGALLAVAVRVA
jgi:hypothetical protein